MEWDTGLTDQDAFARRVRRYASEDDNPADHAAPRRYHLSSGYDLPLLRARVGATAVPAARPERTWMDDVASLTGLAPGGYAGSMATIVEVTTPERLRWWSVLGGVVMATGFVLRLAVV